MVAIEDARRVTLRCRYRAGVVKQLAEFIHRVTDIGAQHIFTKKLVEHLADRGFEERYATRVARAVPGVGAICRVVNQCPEEGWRQRIKIGAGLAQDIARNELRRIFKHVNKAVEFTQDLIRDMARSTRFAVQENRDFIVAETDFIDELAQVIQRILRAFNKLLIINRQYEGRCSALLLRKRSQVAIAGDAKNLNAFIFDGFGQHTDAQPRGVFGAEIFVNDDYGETEFHGGLLKVAYNELLLAKIQGAKYSTNL